MIATSNCTRMLRGTPLVFPLFLLFSLLSAHSQYVLSTFCKARANLHLQLFSICYFSTYNCSPWIIILIELKMPLWTYLINSMHFGFFSIVFRNLFWSESHKKIEKGSVGPSHSLSSTCTTTDMLCCMIEGLWIQRTLCLYFNFINVGKFFNLLNPQWLSEKYGEIVPAFKINYISCDAQEMLNFYMRHFDLGFLLFSCWILFVETINITFRIHQ